MFLFFLSNLGMGASPASNPVAGFLPLDADAAIGLGNVLDAMAVDFAQALDVGNELDPVALDFAEAIFVG